MGEAGMAWRGKGSTVSYSFSDICVYGVGEGWKRQQNVRKARYKVRAAQRMLRARAVCTYIRMVGIYVKRAR